MRARSIAVAAAALSVAAPQAAAVAAPKVEQMIVYRSGKAVTKTVSTAATTVKVGRKRCATGTGTALAALARSRPPKLRLRDFGSCSRRPSDAAALFVSGIGPDRNRGRSGWVYKVGRRSATAGAADPAGPFGRGRLRSGQRVVWFYCALRGVSCQRTLAVRAVAAGDGVTVTVTGYDDEGRGQPAAGATVHVGSLTATTDASGVARLTGMAPGRYRVHAEKAGAIRSFAERVAVG